VVTTSAVKALIF